MARAETLLDAKARGAAAGFDRPLLLTAREDAVGFAGAHLGRAVLFLLAATSVVAVLLIFVFIIREALAFFVDPATLPAADWTSAASAL
ncbi:MAG: hypothetical protein NTY65_00885 [Planctomycetota bacterium]|nr:hypothetical protein [Planctomycetota bacterium]